MSAHNRVIWSEGLFLQPHHFQQQDRYFERYVETRCAALIPHSWGFSTLELEDDLLSIGKFGLQRAVGIFPDGTPFRMPEDEPLPVAIDIGNQVRDQILYLAVPLRRVGEMEVDRNEAGETLARHGISELQARDATSNTGETALLEVGTLRTKYLLASDVSAAYACIPLVHIVECRSDKRVVLDDTFIPTVLQTTASARLAMFATELVGLFHQRGDALGGRVSATGRGSAAELADFLMLQAINRFEPLLAHYAESGAVHPEDLYRACVSAAGELATFTTMAKRPVGSLSVVLEQSAIAIPLEAKKFGISVALVTDRSLYNTAVFILAARADVPAEELRRRFPAQLKIGPVEKIRDLVTLQLPGVPVQPLPVAPRQIPFHAGFAYFELEQSNELWDQLKTSGGVALHVAGEFPGLAMEFWAIRS
jgi:type VI secretion system protein ImpJ